MLDHLDIDEEINAFPTQFEEELEPQFIYDDENEIDRRLISRGTNYT